MTSYLVTAQERYYRIIKAILSGYGKSWFYHQKMTNDPRPTQQTIGALSGVHFEALRRDLKHLVDNGLVKCWEFLSRLFLIIRGFH